MRRFEWYLLILCLIPATWLTIGTGSIILAPETRVEGRKVYFKRGLPFGTVEARWRSEIVVLDGSGFECSSGEWTTSTYQVVRGDAISYPLGDWAIPCIEMNSNYTLRTVRQVMLFGVIPLRPSTTIDLIEVAK